VKHTKGEFIEDDDGEFLGMGEEDDVLGDGGLGGGGGADGDDEAGGKKRKDGGKGKGEKESA
jgi:hypothetical protein